MRQAIVQKKARLEEQRLSLKRRLESELEPTARKAPGLERQLSEAASAIEAADQEEETLGRESARLQDLVVQVRTLKDSLVRLEDEGKESPRQAEAAERVP